MAEPLDLNKVVADCELYWRTTRVPGRRIADMKLELSQHLAEATSNGRKIESVIGATWPSLPRPGRPNTATAPPDRLGKT